MNAAEYQRLRALLAKNEELRPVQRAEGTWGVLLVRDDIAVREVGAGLRIHPRVARNDPLWALRAELLGEPAVIPLRPQSVPADLLTVQPDAELLLRDMTAEFDIIVKGKRARAIAGNRVSHTLQQLWTATEAAAWIADKSGDDAGALRREFERAFKDGKLAFGRPGSGFALRLDDPPPHPELTHPGYRIGEWPDAEGMAYLTAAVVNDWLQREHPVSRIRLPTQQATERQTAASGADRPPKLEADRRERLIAAFRVEYGSEHALPFYMRGDNKVGDPALKVARAVLSDTGQAAVRKLVQDLAASGEIGPRDRQLAKDDPRLQADPAP